MPVLIWSDRDGILGSAVRTGRRVALSAEEFRHEAESLDRQLDDLLDMAWHTLKLITDYKDGKPRFDTLEQAWVWGRAIHLSHIMQHPALIGEQRLVAWQAFAAKAWYGVRSDLKRDRRWRQLIPAKSRGWRTKPCDIAKYRFLEIGNWLREDSLQQVGEVFCWKFSNANDLYDRSSLRSVELRRAVLQWIQRQDGDARRFLATPIHKGKRHALIAKALQKRFPARGPGSALLPQHYAEAELLTIVAEVLDAAIETAKAAPSSAPA